MKAFIASKYQRIKGIYKKYERFLMPATLIGGFLLDYITFTSIQIGTTFMLLLGYWIFAGVVIAFTHLYDAGKLPPWLKFKYIRLFWLLLVQFAFGSLLGSSLIFYWFSGALSISWPIMAALVVLMVANDRFRHWFEKPLVHMGVYFFATLSLLSVLLPFVFSSLSVWLFVVAGAGSLIIFGAYVYFLSRVAGHLRAQRRKLFIVIIAITFAMNALYFTNIIPPIPLALREAGLYHSLQSTGGKYVMQGEPEDFFEILKTALLGQTLHVTPFDAAQGKPGEKIYLYTAIFAPANLKTTIVHHWQYYDEAQKEWVERGELPFTISGGRKEGYKGYSYNSNLASGRWRISVENVRGQVLGRVRFAVERVDKLVDLQEVIR